jgi:hypothetical protein
MYYYHQHPIVLVGSLLENLLLGLLGVGLALYFKQILWLLLLLPALLLALRNIIAWASFRIRLRGRQLFIRSLQGLSIREQLLPVSNQAAHEIQQNLPGYLLDYGTIQLDAYGEPIDLRYIARFRTFTQQLDRIDRHY